MDSLIEILKEIEINPEKQERLASAIRSWIRQQFQNYDYYDAVAYGDLMEALGI